MIKKAETPRERVHPLEEAAECLKTLGHPVRLRMIELLSKKSYSVGELAKACFIPSHMASEHLRLMKICGFLESRREGRKTFYYIVEPHLADLMQCVIAKFRTEEAESIDSNKKRGGKEKDEGRDSL